MRDPDVFCSDYVCCPRRLESLDLVRGVEKGGNLPQLVPVVRPNQKNLPVAQVCPKFMLEVVVLEDYLRRLQDVLSIDNSKLSILNSWPLLHRTGCQPLWHDADGLSIPLHVVHEVIYLPLYSPVFA